MRDIRRTPVVELFRIFKLTLPAIFSILNNVSIRRNICLKFRKFTRENKSLFWQKWTPDVFFYFRPPCLCPSEVHKYGASVLISINLCGKLCQISRVRNTAQTWGLNRVLIYLSSITYQFLDFIHWMVFDFYFNAVTVKTGNTVTNSKLLTWENWSFTVFSAILELKRLYMYSCSSGSYSLFGAKGFLVYEKETFRHLESFVFLYVLRIKFR